MNRTTLRNCILVCAASIGLAWYLWHSKRWIKLGNHKSAINDLSCSRTDSLIASASFGWYLEDSIHARSALGVLPSDPSSMPAVNVWNIGMGTNAFTTVSLTRSIVSAAISPDGTMLVYGTQQDGAVTVMPIQKSRSAKSFYNHTGAVTCCRWINESTVISSSADHSLCAVAIDGTSVTKLGGHNALVSHVEVDDSGGRAVSCSYDGTVRLWDLRKRSEIGKIDFGHHRLETLALASDGKSGFVGVGKSLVSFDVQGSKELGRATVPAQVESIAPLLCPGVALICGSDKRVYLCDTVANTSKDVTTRLHVGGSWRIAIPADRKSIVLGTTDGDVFKLVFDPDQLCIRH